MRATAKAAKRLVSLFIKGYSSNSLLIIPAKRASPAPVAEHMEIAGTLACTRLSLFSISPSDPRLIYALESPEEARLFAISATDLSFLAAKPGSSRSAWRFSRRGHPVGAGRIEDKAVFRGPGADLVGDTPLLAQFLETGEQPQFLNNNLRWETNYNTNLGLDVNLKNVVRFSLELYSRLTKDLLMNEPTSLTTGFSSILSNIGEMRNRGIEFEVMTNNISNKNFNWTSSFNISHNNNEILVLDGIQTSIISGTQIRMVGKP